MALYLTLSHLNTLQHHAGQQYPLECCGILLGQIRGDRRSVVSVIAGTNLWQPESAAEAAHSQRDRFLLDPRDLLLAQRQARETSLSVLGIYHSHPNHDAIPSACDRRHAWPEYSYLILAIHNREISDLQSWRLDPEGQFNSELIIVSELAESGLPH
jgi:proteasome lid subunit RPN8/RPN11